MREKRNIQPKEDEMDKPEDLSDDEALEVDDIGKGISYEKLQSHIT